MRKNITDPWWLIEGIDIIGFEKDEEDSDDDEDDEEDADDEEESDDEDEDSDDEDSDDEDDDEESEDKDKDKSKQKRQSTKGLKSALQKERMRAKRAERRVRELESKYEPPKDKDKGGKPKSKDKEDDESESTSNAAADAKVKALAKKLKDNAVDTAILGFGEKFKSSKELLALVDRSEILVEQDEDEPSEIDIDLESVEDAVKALAKSSPHLLQANGTRTRSGSQFGGKNKGTKKASEDSLRKKYSALRR